MTASIAVGTKTIAWDDAERVLAQYTAADANARAKKPFAYPAYDLMDSGADPSRLTDGDLLAPQLLNVQVKLVTSYSLQRLRPQLELALADSRLGTPLAKQDDQTIEETVNTLYAVLDDEPPGIQGTTLSKVLHRKRPLSIVLHDVSVQACYRGGPRVERVKERSWSDYMVLMTKAIRDDIVTQQETFDALSACLPLEVRLSDVRILDILAWSLGKSRGSLAE